MNGRVVVNPCYLGGEVGLCDTEDSMEGGVTCKTDREHGWGGDRSENCSHRSSRMNLRRQEVDRRRGTEKAGQGR